MARLLTITCLTLAITLTACATSEPAKTDTATPTEPDPAHATTPPRVVAPSDSDVARTHQTTPSPRAPHAHRSGVTYTNKSGTTTWTLVPATQTNP